MSELELRVADEKVSVPAHAKRALEEFEGIGKLYEARFGRLRPGKDDIFHNSMDEDNVRQFSDWIKHQALTDAIFRIAQMEAALEAISDNLPDGECTWDECAKSSAKWADEGLRGKFHE